MSKFEVGGVAARRAFRVCAITGVSAVTAVAAALPAFADTPADRATTAFSVLPPGNGDVWGPTARHASDQIKLYEGLESVAANGTLGRPGTAAPHYKQAGFTPQRVVREERPAPGVLIRWDQWGVPYISAPDIRRVSFGAGWAQAQSRLLILEALRTLGRGGVVESLTATRPPGAGGRPLVNYTDKELETGFDELFAEAGEDTDDLRDGTDGYLAGINAWLAANRNRIPGSMRLPFGLGRIGTPKPWKRADAAAAAMVINDVFGVGGGGELGAARALRALQDRLGTQAGMALYEDLRIPDPGATTHTATPSPYPVFAAKEGGEWPGG
jgi:hypothetical protein